MIKSVLVTLGIDIGKFTSGLNQARSGFNSFVGGIGGGINSAVSFLGHLGDAVELAMTAINGLINVGKSLFDTFVADVAAEQQLTTQLGVLMGGMDKAKDFINGVEDANLRLGFVTDEMIPGINQAATAFKALDGAVDPGKLEQFVDLMRRMKAARPDLDFGTIAQTLIKGMRGDLESMKRTLGIGIDDIQGLSEKAKATMAAMQTTSDQQLGAVTKVGGGVKAKTEDVLALLDEALGKIGMGEEAVVAYGDNWGAQIARLTGIWNIFKNEVGAPILEVLIDQLKKLGDWLVEHKEEIKEFAEKLGKMTAEGLKNAIEALMKVDWDKVMQGAEGLVEAFSKIDWEQVGKVMGDIDKAFNNPNSTPQGAGEQLAKSIQNGSAQQSIFDWLNKAGASVFGGSADVAAGGGAIQKVQVQIDMDPNGNWKTHVQQTAAQTVSDVVDSATKSGGSAATSKRQTE